MEVCGVELRLRPQVLSQMVLRCRIPHDRPPQLLSVSSGQGSAEGALQIEMAEAFADADPRRDARVSAAVFVAARGHGPSDERAGYIVPMLRIPAQEAVF